MTHTVHGALVLVDGVGVLLTGESGTGKSECALELLSHGHRLVADDVVLVERVGATLTGRAPEKFAGFIAIRDLGIFDVRRAVGEDAFSAECKIGLCMELREDRKSTNELIGLSRQTIKIVGVKLPFLKLSVDPRRNFALLVETAVQLVRTDADDAELELIRAHNVVVASIGN